MWWFLVATGTPSFSVHEMSSHALNCGGSDAQVGCLINKLISSFPFKLPSKGAAEAGRQPRAAGSAPLTALTPDGLLQWGWIYCRDHSSRQMWHISATGHNSRYINCCWQRSWHYPKGKPEKNVSSLSLNISQLRRRSLKATRGHKVKFSVCVPDS